MDHINGILADHRLENLRLLCPNCHTQTDTFAGRNVKTPRKEKKYCECGNILSIGAKYCRKCILCYKVTKTKIDWPSNEELLEMLQSLGSYIAIANKLGVSDNAVRKRLKRKIP